MPDRQQKPAQQQLEQQQQQQQQQEHMKLWKRYGDVAPLSPLSPNQSTKMNSAATPTRVPMSPLTPSSGFQLDPNDPFISAFMKRIPDAKFDERTGTLSGVTMWVSSISLFSSPE